MQPPIRKLVLPADLVHCKPGELPINLLRDVKPFGKLHHLAAASWTAMRQAAFASGIKQFKPTSAGDTYRSLAQQRAGFLQRYQLEPIAGASTRTWEGRKYYLKPGNAPLAAPGSSRHNLGLAVDIAGTSDPILWKWLCENAPKYGWSLEVMPAEPWHWFYFVGDKTPPALMLDPATPAP
jgi:LAS superfamily LD-carboxypeptidase LdcB